MVRTFEDGRSRKGHLIPGRRCPLCGGHVVRQVPSTLTPDDHGLVTCQDSECPWKEDDH